MFIAFPTLPTNSKFYFYGFLYIGTTEICVMKIQSVGYQISYTGKIPSRKGALSASTNVQKSSKSKVLANDHFKFASFL